MKLSVLSGYGEPYFHYFLLEFVAVADGFVTCFCAVVVDGGDGVAQELCYFHTVADAEPDQGEYA